MAKRGGFPGGGAMPGNMANLMKQAQRMQRQMEEGQKELETKEFTATSGGGAVEAKVSGAGLLTSLTLKEEIVDPEDIETLQDSIIAAVNDALGQVEEAKAGLKGGMAGGLGGLPF
ncbi:MAG: YbaB/EbfC family nucleoid-associated protein [Lachnospiraceae bacterium]|nr:YbaB/EbfC family nucleoid-associated protein [Lachnospiraceae bacterium]